MLLVAATTSAIVLAFVIPMCLLVQTLAEDRGLASAQQQAQSVAVLVSSVGDTSAAVPTLTLATAAADGSRSSVLLPGGVVVGADRQEMVADPTVQRAQRERSAFSARGAQGVVVVVPVALGSGTAVVRTVMTGAEVHEGVSAAWLGIGSLGAALLIAALIAASVMARRISIPVSRLAGVAHRLRSGEVDARAEEGGPAEVQELGTALNQLADRIGDLLQAEREAVADLSHRLRTPVTALRLDSESVSDPVNAERLREHVDQLQRAVDAIVRDARRPVRGAMPARCDAAAAVRDRVEFWRPLAEDQGRQLAVEIPTERLEVSAGVEDVSDLVDNLLDNVFAHTPEGSAVSVAVRADALKVLVTVADGGPGFMAGADAVARGESGADSSGLGLDIVRRIARSSGGEAALGSSALGGAQVTVSLGRV